MRSVPKPFPRRLGDGVSSSNSFNSCALRVEAAVASLSDSELPDAIGWAGRLSAILTARLLDAARPQAVVDGSSPEAQAGLWKANKAAAYLGLPLPSFYRLVRRGAVPRVPLGDGRRGTSTLRFDPADLRAYVAARRQKGV